MRNNDFTPIQPRELLKLNRDTLRGLRAVFGFNPSMPSLILRAATPPTKAAARRAADAAGYPADEAIFLIDSSRAAWASNDYQYDAALLDVSGGLDILTYREFCAQREHGARRALDNLYAKKEYDEKRKIPGTVFYIVLQHVEHRLPPVVRDLDKIETGKRYKVHPHGAGMYITESGTNRDAARLYTWRARDAAGMLDKSGYNVTGPRESLKRRAALLKEARAREAYQASDTEKDAAEIEKEMDALRRTIGFSLINATTDDAERLLRAIDRNYWRTFDVFTDAAAYIARSRAKDYRSREAAERDARGIRAKLGNCYRIINETTGRPEEAAS